MDEPPEVWLPALTEEPDVEQRQSHLCKAPRDGNSADLRTSSMPNAPGILRWEAQLTQSECSRPADR